MSPRALILALAFALCAQAQIPWAPITWQSATLGGKTVHAVLLVELHLDGVKPPVLMQLDTGCDTDLIYGISYDQFSSLPPRDGRNQIPLSGNLAGTRFHREPFYVRGDAGISWIMRTLQSLSQRLDLYKGKPILFGTIGAAFLEHRILLLDFVRQRIAILPKGDELPATAIAHIAFTPLEYRDRKMFLRLTLAGEERRDLAFDTGSSALPIATTQTRWLAWTGRRPDDPRNLVMFAKSWDNQVRLVGAPLKGDLCVGAACLPAPLAFFETTGLATSDFDRYPFKIAGLIGNRLFEGRYTVMIDLAHRRLGLYPGSLE
jgi:hypothetical protein